MGFDTTMRKEIVVAHYKEDLSWLEKIPRGWLVKLYHKDESYGGPNKLPNIGHETHTFLHHIIENYENLADVTAFVQGYPLDQAPDLFDKLRTVVAEESYTPVGRKMLPIHGLMYNDEKTSLIVVAERLGIGNELRFDGSLFFPYGAHMIVNRSAILSRQKEWYESAMKYLLESPYPNAWAFEYLWPTIFRNNGYKNAVGLWIKNGFSLQTTVSESGDGLSLLTESLLLLHGLGLRAEPGFGTLLGLYRDSRLIPHDSDVDINVFQETPGKVSMVRDAIVSVFEDAGYELVLRDNEQVVFLKGESLLPVDICIFTKMIDKYVCNHQVKRFVIPFDAAFVAEKQLEFIYGKEWRTPVPKEAEYLHGEGCQ